MDVMGVVVLEIEAGISSSFLSCAVWTKLQVLAVFALVAVVSVLRELFYFLLEVCHKICLWKS